MAGRFSIEAVIKAVDKVSAPISRMQARITSFSKKAEKSFKGANEQLTRMSTGARDAGTNMALALAGPALVMGEIIKTGATFEQSLVNAGARFGAGVVKGTEAFVALEAAAKETGRTTEFSASQAAEALNFLAMAGFTADEAVAALPGVVDLATASGVDLAQATDIASDTLGGFGLKVQDLERVNDVLAKTTTTANTNMEQFFEAMAEGAPVAAAAGAQIEVVSAMIGTLANAGIKGSNAGTTLKNLFIRLASPTPEAKKVLDALGVSTRDAAGNIRPVLEILGDIERTTKELGTADRTAVLDTIFGKIPIAGVNVLLKKGQKELEKYTEVLKASGKSYEFVNGQIREVPGAAKVMADTMRDTVQGRFNSLKSAIEGVSIEIFSMNDGPLAEVITMTTEWVRANGKLIATKVGEWLKFLIENVNTILAIAVGVTGFIATLMTLSSVVGLITNVITIWKFAMIALNVVLTANPIGLIVMAVGALIAAGIALYRNWDTVVAFFVQAWAVMQKAAFDFVDWITGGQAQDIIDAWTPVLGFFEKLLSGLAWMFQQYLGMIFALVGKLKGVAEFALGLGSKVAQVVAGGATDIIKGTGNALSFLVGGEETGEGGATRKQEVVGPEQIFSSLVEKVKKSEVLLRNETSSTLVPTGPLNGVSIEQSGGF